MSLPPILKRPLFSLAPVALASLCAALPALSASSPAPHHAAAAAAITFNRDIRPILTDNCFTCHGPDHNKRMAGLRLDVREEAISRGAIVPGKPALSKLIARVFSADAGERMPPFASRKQLTAAQKETLRRWVAQGARYEKHWAFVPPAARVPIPAVKHPEWCRSAIDRFVLAKLEQEGLKPSPEAPRAIWLRRVTLDLTGVPPSLAEADAFFADTSPTAYEKVVDRLLASPRYGQRMAVPWLDAARYADSYGYQSDQLCPTWPYRDWVVKAFNENLPYDQFLTWQLAGDLLPNATREQRLATAFNRLHRMTNEGGSVPDEWRQEGVADRVNTFGTAVLGITLECARCHDHKYDPISQKDYYSVSAFFDSIDEYGLYDRADIVPTPSLLLPTPEQEAQEQKDSADVQRAEESLRAAETSGEPRFQAWLTNSGNPTSPVPASNIQHPASSLQTPASSFELPSRLLSDCMGWFDFEGFDGAAVPNRVPGARFQGARSDAVNLVEGHSGKAVEFDGENNVNFPELGRFTRSTPFTLAFWMRDPRIAAEPAVVFQACDGTDTGPHGYDLLIESGRLTARIFRHWPGNAIAVKTRIEIPKDTWTHVAVTYDGSSRAAGLKIYLNGHPADLDVLRDRLYKGTGIHTLVFGQRFRDRGFKGGRLDDLGIFERALTSLEVAQLADGHSFTDALRQPAGHEKDLREYYFSAVDRDARKTATVLQVTRGRVVGVEDAQFEVPVMEELPQPRPTYLLARGRYDAPKTDATRVERDVPASILPFPSDLPRNRLGLARWVTRPDNPLTSRVAVNRIWAIFFGRGLVETSENFGLQGRPPTHPQLLDWLASGFTRRTADAKSPAANGEKASLYPAWAWDTKALVKEIVLSGTYRQASTLRPDLQKRDPENLLLARGPSYRLSAEQVRDTALAASGLLDESVGGPPVSPYLPGDLWRESNTMSPAYHQSVGGDLYRRSLYTVWKRTTPMPDMLAFDAPSREVCTARRQRTSTPLQALILLNDTQFVEAARVLGEHVVKEGGATTADRVRYAFRRLATREPTPEEARLLGALYEQELATYTSDPTDAGRLLKIGERKPDPSLPPAEVAAAAILAQTILNLDATMWKR